MTINYKDHNQKYDDFFTEKSLGFRTKNIDNIKNIVKLIHAVIDQVNFGFYPEGIKISTMDQSHVSFIDILIPKEFFSNYNCGNGFVKGINLKYLIQILNHLNKDDDLIMLFENNCDEIDIKFINCKYSKFYTLKLLEIENEGLTIPELEDMSIITLSSNYFNNIINDFNDIGTQLRFKILKDKEKISLKCDGEMTNLKMILHDEDIETTNLQDIELYYNIKHIQTFTKFYVLNSKIEINIKQDLPIILKYTIMDTGYMNYYIAPKLEDDDDFN